MIILLLLSIPLSGILIISTKMYPNIALGQSSENTLNDEKNSYTKANLQNWYDKHLKTIALKTSILTLAVSLVIFALFDFSNNQFQFVQEYHEVNSFNFYLGVDGLSIYFVLLTTIIMPISLLSN